MKPKLRLIAALKIWVVIYPSITLFLFLFGQQLSALPLYVRTFVLTATLVPWMMFVGVPFVDRIIKALSAMQAGEPQKSLTWKRRSNLML